MKKAEIALSACCIAFFSFMLYEAYQLHGVGRFGEVGSALWPMIALGASTLLSACWLAVTLRGPAPSEGTGSTEEPATESCASGRDGMGRVAFSVGCILLYIVVIPVIGFVLATFLFVAAFAVALGERRPAVLVVSPFLITAITLLVFLKFIAIPFPKGIGIFAEFSRLLY